MKMTASKAEHLIGTIEEAVGALEGLRDYLEQLVSAREDRNKDSADEALDNIEGWFSDEHGNVSYVADELNRLAP